MPRSNKFRLILGLVLVAVSLIRPFGLKAHAFASRHPKDDARINILEGAVRSSKTFSIIPKLLQLTDYHVGGVGIITGVSKQTIYNNVLNDVFSIVGPSNYTYNRQSGDLHLLGSHWITMGAKDEGSEKYVRGLTVGKAISDELTLQPRSFVMMLLNRMSPEGARFYATTNPDSPFHYVKTDLLDNQKLRSTGQLWSEHFTLEDNPNLSEEYKQFVRSMYTGVFKLRYIDGLWVVAEGGIYKDCWDDSLYYSDATAPAELYDPAWYAERYIPVDCGVDHPQVYLDMIDDGKTIWVDREYWWDSNVTTRQKTDRQYREDLEKFIAPADGAQVILPPEAASFDAELTQAGIWHTDADNDVMDGIKVTSSMLSMKRIRFRVNESCRNLQECVCGRQCVTHTSQQMQTYVWDPKAKQRGVEQPLKMKDDGPDCVRYGIKTKVHPYRVAA